MSKPDPAGGSLENILASIRRSLAEQSTDALGEEPAGAQADAPPAVRKDQDGPVQPAAAPEPGQSQERRPGEDDLSDLLEDREQGGAELLPEAPEPSGDVEQAAQVQPGSGRKDPLWFLSRGRQTEPARAEKPVADAIDAAPQALAPARDPKPARPDLMRASRPPFFGTPAEPDKSETIMQPEPPVLAPMPVSSVARADEIPVPVPPAAVVPTPVPVREAVAPKPEPPRMPEPVVLPPVRVATPPQAAPRAEPKPVRESPPPAPVPEAPVASLPPTDAVAPPATAGAKPMPAQPAPARTSAPPAGALGNNTQALEAVVVEMLQPMLRQWLDANMPRLVAAALREEAIRAAGGRDADKA